MSTSPIAIAKVRTYATDLNSVRTKKNLPARTIIAVPESIKSTEQVIPPFHTFDHTTTAPVLKSTGTVVVPPKIITLGAEVTAADVAKEVMPAVIITDTKHKRFNLSHAITTGVYTWWGSKKEIARKKKIPRYTVPEAKRRKGVIQKATTKTGVASTSDHDSVLARIKAAKQIPHTLAEAATSNPLPIVPANNWLEEIPSPVITTVKASIPKTIVPTSKVTVETILPQTKPLTPEVTLARQSSWDSDIQVQVNALGETNSKLSTVPSPIILTGKEFSKIKQARAVLATPKILPRVPEIPLQVIPVELPYLESTASIKRPTPTAHVVVPVIPVDPYPIQTIPTPIQRPKILPVIPPLAEQQTTLEIPTPKSAPASEPTVETVLITPANILPSEYLDARSIRGSEPAAPERRFAPPREQKRSLITTITQTNQLVFIAFGVLLFIVISGLGLRSYLQASPSPQTAVAPLPTTFINAVVANTPQPVTDKMSLFTAVTEQTGGAESLTELSIINPTTGQSITAQYLFSLLETTVVFDFESAITDVAVGNYRGNPWILLTVSDKNTARGGMYTWEKSLSVDLDPLFGTTVSNSSFRDGVVGQNDVRILKNDSMSEQITYGLIGTNKVLITTDTTAYLNLAGNLPK